MNARFALTMIHFGLGEDQLYAVWGEHANSGSNYDHDGDGKGNYNDGNNAEYGVDHNDVKHDATIWSGHPSEKDMKIIKAAHDLSPGCSGSNYWCADLEWKIFDEKGWPDIIIEDPTHGSYAYSADFLGNATEKGVKHIKILGSLPAAEDGGDPVIRNYIEITRRFEELAIAIGAEGPDVAAAVEKEKAAFCNAAEDFKKVTKDAADRGVRVLAGYFPYLAPNDGLNEDGKSIYGFLYSPSAGFPVLQFLEELGMQLLHNPAGPDYNANMMPDDLTASNVEGTPRYPVDFLLYDARVTLDVETAEFAKKWPHPAVAAGQIAPWSNGAQGIFSYQHAAEMLPLISARLSTAKKLDATETTCTEVKVISSQDHRSTGLEAMEYACHNPVEFSWCEGLIVETTGAPSEESAAAFAAVGLMLALLA
jgi:hypothetical protein